MPGAFTPRGTAYGAGASYTPGMRSQAGVIGAQRQQHLAVENAAQTIYNRLPSTYPGPPTGHWKFLGPPGKKDESFRPFPAQWEIFQTIRVPWPGVDPRTGTPYPLIWGLNCGRRFSKTTIGEKLLWTGALAPDDFFGPPQVKLTADTDEHAMKIWRLFIWHLENTPLRALKADYSKEYDLVTFKNGATVQRLSAHNPQALSGDGVTLWIIDEAQYITQAAWDNLLPSTAERSGVIVMLGVSEGEGPFREVCFKGDSPDYPEFQRLAYPTAANPYVPKWVIDFHARTLPPNKFKQLYLAQWVNELGRIFRNVEGCIDDKLIVHVHPDQGYGFCKPPMPGHTYYMGVDLARLTDWMVITIWDRSGTLVAWDRYSLVSWELQKARAAALSAAYGHPSCVVDSTGMGADAIFDDLLSLGMNVHAYTISGNDKKRQLIDELAIRIGSGSLRYPRIQTFIEELQRFEAKRSTTPGSTVVRYEAPAGFHDDFVLSAALAMQALPRPPARIIPAALQSGDPYSQRFPTIYVDEHGQVREGINPMDDPFRQKGAYEFI